MPKMFPALILAFGMAAASFAQPVQVPEADPSETIVVEGKRQSGKDIDRFVDALIDAPPSGQIGRFDEAACPAAVGLGKARNEAIAARLRTIAQGVGLPVGPAGCRPNVLLFVAGDKGALIEQLQRKYPAYFEGLERAEMRRLVSDRSAASAWHVERMVDADGVAVPRDETTGQYLLQRTDAPSRLATSMRPQFIAAVVVVQLDSLAGLTVTQIADYAAMRAFTRSDPNRLGRSAAPTILTVLGAPMDSAVPVTLTQWDLAVLKSLYASNTNRTASLQRDDIKRRVRTGLADRGSLTK